MGYSPESGKKEHPEFRIQASLPQSPRPCLFTLTAMFAPTYAPAMDPHPHPRWLGRKSGEKQKEKIRAPHPCTYALRCRSSQFHCSDQNQRVASVFLLYLSPSTDLRCQTMLSPAQQRPKYKICPIHDQFGGPWTPGSPSPQSTCWYLLTVQRLQIAATCTLSRFYTQGRRETALCLLHPTWNWNIIRF